MNGPIINPGLMRKRIAAIEDRLKRYPNHPDKERMLANRDKYEQDLASPPETMGRKDVLENAICKIDTMLLADPQHKFKKRMGERRKEYQQALSNIQEYGCETPPSIKVGTKIDVPALVLNQRNK